ncbi:MAG: recombinase family protein, partial [Acidobacteria bacterium]|nr:recombinase family protein [Acidobacteriota bacterium]
MTKPYLPYARTSSDEQKDAETIRTQITSVEAHAHVHNTPIASEWVMDDGVSGTVPFHERAGGAHALELLKTGAYAGLICLNHKRIGRDAYVIHLAVRQIEHELRLDILAIREPVPSQIAPGARALMRAMYAGVAEFDRVEFLSWMNAGKVRAAKEGRWSGGSVPYGLKLSVERTSAHSRPVKRLVVDDASAPTILEIFTLYAAGHSQSKIAEDLNARGAAHPTGHRWRQTTISYMLRNPFYKGEGVWRRRYEGKNARGGTSKYNSPAENVIAYEDYKVPAIVPVELWQRCAELCVANITSATRNARRFYLLRGIVRCGLCDRSMTDVFIKTSGHQYYRCTSRSDAHVENCALKDVRADGVERLVWSGIESFAHAPGKT